MSAPYHKHTILPDKHQTFLEQQRQDPVTGESIRAYDRVVFCAACGSAFLEDSWEYLGREHCRQQRTLPKIPESSDNLSLRWELDGSLFQATQIQPAKVTLLSVGSAALLLQVFISIFHVSSDIQPFLVGSVYALSTLLPLPFQAGRVSAIEIFKNGFRVRRILKKKSTYRLQNIQQFRVKHRKGFLLTRRLIEVHFQFKDGTEESIVFDSSQKRARIFFHALAYLSAQVPVYFELAEGKEKDYVRQLRQELRLGENFRLDEPFFPEADEKKSPDLPS